MSDQRPDAASADARLAKFRRIFPQAWLARDIYSRGDLVRVDFPQDLDELCDVHISMAHESGRIYAEANTMLDEDTTSVVLRKAMNAPDGLYQARIRPKASEFYGATPFEVTLPFHVINSETSASYYGDNPGRRAEALKDAIRRGPDLYSELARLARGETVREQLLLAASENGDPRDLLALLFILGKYRQTLPATLAATLNGNLRRGDLSAIGGTPPAIACRRLAGLRFKRRDSSDLETRAWLMKRATDGFDFFTPLTDELMALAALVDLDEEFGELAAALLDKLLFTLALHTTDFARDSRLSPLSPVTRLLWGLGNWNPANAAAVFLACADEYEIPALIQAIAIDPNPPLSAIDQHRISDALIQRQVYRGANCSLVSVNQRWLAELGTARVFAETPSLNLRHEADSLACQGAKAIYFPTYEFDEWTIDKNWTYARRADCYLALHSERGFALLESGTRRGRVLHVGDADAPLTVCLGYADKDGDFKSFKERPNRESPPWREEPAIPSQLHYRSRFCQTDFEQSIMEIRYDDFVMQLDLTN